MRVGLFLAIPVRLYREGLRATLEKRHEIEVVGESSTLTEVADSIISSAAAVAIVDVAHPNAESLIRILRNSAPRMRILAFAVEERLASVLPLAEAGAHGFFSANGSIDDLIAAVVKTAEGEIICSPKVVEELLTKATTRSDCVQLLPRLTDRERQVFQLLRRGCSNKEIARALTISGATVKNHIHHLLDKMQVKTRTQALARFGSASSLEPSA